MGFVPSIPVAFAMLFISMIAWGSWTNAQKGTGNWRFEGFYWDYAWSIVVSTFLLAAILGGVSPEGWSATQYVSGFGGNAPVATMWALAAGFLWGIGNLLLVVSISLAGLAIAFPIGVGLALVLGTFLAYITNPAATKDPQSLFIGLFIVSLAIVANSLAYKTKEKQASKNKNLKRGIIISVLCGLFLSLYAFPFNYAFKLGLTGYEGAQFMTIGGFLATLVLLPLLMRKPLIPGDKPVSMAEYKRAKPHWHVWGFVAGFIWSIGTVFNLTVASNPEFSVAIAYTIGNCAPMVAALWGIFVWKEFKGAPKESYMYLVLMFGLFIAGIISLANAAR